MEREKEGSGLGKVLLLIYSSLLLFTIILMLASVPAGLYAVYYTNLSNTSLSYATRVDNLGLFVGIFTFYVPVAASYGSIFAVSTVIYTVLLIYAGAQKMNIVSAIRSALTNGSGEVFRNSLLATVIALGALTLSVGIIDLIQTGAGIKTGSIGGDPLALFVSITFAPLREELGFRVALIGVVAFILALRTSLRTALKALWRPSAILRGGSVDLPEKVGLAVMIVLSSIIFGLAHIISGAGWEIGKLSEAAFAGLVLGYLYVRYGFHAAVLLHWGVNYFGSAFAFFGQGVWGIPWESEFGNPLSTLVDADLFVFIGVTSLFLVGDKIIKRLAGARDVIGVDSGGSVNPQGPGPQVQGDQPLLQRKLRRGRIRLDGEGRQDSELP